jgi:hypothetical protein
LMATTTTITIKTSWHGHMGSTFCEIAQK